MTITLNLPPDVQSKLEAIAKQSGQDIEVVAGNLVRQAIEHEDNLRAAAIPAFPPNEQALAALHQIAGMQEGMRQTDGSQTDRLIRDGRAGGMYSDPSE